MIGVDLFAGAGGMSLGAVTAGIDIHCAVEKDKYAAATYKTNHPGVDVFVGDIRDFTSDGSLGEKFGDEELVVFGGPPCRGFSTSNQRTRTKGNDHNWLFEEYTRVVRELSPDWIVFENVQGFVETSDGEFFEMVCNAFESLSYTLSWKILNAANVGVPQKRKRLFIIGSRAGIEIDFEQIATKPTCTVGEALADLPSLPNGASRNWRPYQTAAQSQYATQLRGDLERCSNHLVTRNAPHIVERYKHVPPGGNWEDIPKQLMTNYSNLSACHSGIYHRLDPRHPSKVIGNYRKNMLIHPSEHRGLSVREAARLQSFPDAFQFCGSIGFQQQQVGNAVPPKLAEAVFQLIVDTSS